RLDLSIHHRFQLVDSEADAVIRQAVLREVVGADFFAAVSRAHHGLALFGKGLLLLFHFDFVEARAQHAHAFFAILDLRLFVLAADDGIRRDMRDAHRRVRRVHRLAARARRAEGIDTKVFGFDLDVDVFGLRQHGNGDGGRVDAPLLLGGWHALHAVYAAFVLE